MEEDTRTSPSLPNHTRSAPSFLTHFRAAAFAVIFHFLHSQAINSFHQSIVFIVATLVAFLQFKYQGSDKSPFDTHPNTIRVAVSTSLIYFVAHTHPLRFSLGRLSSTSLANHCMVWSGNALVASLGSILFPDSIRPFLYAVCVILSAPELLHWLYKRIVEENKELYTRYFGRVVGRFALQLFL